MLSFSEKELRDARQTLVVSPQQQTTDRERDIDWQRKELRGLMALLPWSAVCEEIDHCIDQKAEPNGVYRELLRKLTE